MHTEYYITQDMNTISSKGHLLSTDSFVISGPYASKQDAKSTYDLVDLPEMKGIWANEITKGILEIEII